ncbi:DeoR family transcriptional regulator [Enterococcus faecium]|nr:DeoR family transcriptional regulator [Enterococcus faecium]
MIEDYIEKDIIRQVKLTEYLYDLKFLRVKQVAKRLDVTFNTVKRDFLKITDILKEYIEYSEITSTTIHLSFFNNFSRYDLIKEIYKESKFLRVCSRYLMGDTSYTTIVDEEFVSVAKAFKIKKEVEKYLQATNIMDKDGNFVDKELELRFVTLSVWMRCDLLNEKIDEKLYNLARIFVDQVLDRLSNGYEMNNREYQFLLLSAYLVITRKDRTTLHYSDEEFQYLKGTTVFKHIKDIAEIVLEQQDIAESEIAYFVSIYRSVNLNTNNYLIVHMNYMQKRELFIEQHPKTVKNLIKYLEDEFDVDLTRNILFEKPFMNFLNTLWYNLQNYTVEQHYYLSESQLELFSKVKKILNRWKENFQLDYVEFNNTSLEKLCSEIESSLIKKVQDKFAIIIVAEDELSHVLYRENLIRWLNMDYNVIDHTMYYSIEDVPVYAEEWPHIIVCERSLLSQDGDKRWNLFSISKNTLFNDIKNILLYIYECQ